MEFKKEEHFPNSVLNVSAYKLEDSYVNKEEDKSQFQDMDYIPREMTKKSNSKALKGFCSDDIKKKLAEINY